MKAALVATWTQPVPGREEKALAYGAEVNAYWSRQAQEGKCTEPEMFFCEHGMGMWMVKGERDDLVALSSTDEARLLSMKGELLLTSFALDVYHTGDAADLFMGDYSRALESVS